MRRQLPVAGSALSTANPGLAAAGQDGASALFRPFFWMDADFRVCGWPQSTARHTGLPAAAAIGKRCWQVVHSEAGDEPPPCFRICFAQAQELHGAPAPGRACRLRCGALALGGIAGAVAVWFPFARALSAGPLDLLDEEVRVNGCLAMCAGSLSNLVDAVRRISSADDCEVFLLDRERSEVVLADCEGLDRDAFMERTRIPLGEGYPGIVTVRQAPLYTNDFQHERLFLRARVRQCGIRSFLGMPLHDTQGPIGYLGLGWRDSRVPLVWVLRMLQHAQPLLGSAIGAHRAAVSAQAPRVTGTPRPELQIRCFGRFEVSRGDEPVSRAEFVRRKAVLLLKILLLRKGVPITADALVELLWPGSGSESGANRLHGVLHALRQAIEPGHDPRNTRFVVFRGGGYVLDPAAPVQVDLYRFQQLTEELQKRRNRGEPTDRLELLLEEAFALYRGDLFADDPEDDTFEEQRMALLRQYVEIARDLAGAHVRWNRGDRAAQLLQRTLTLAGPCEELHRMLIEVLIGAGRLAEARQEYARCLRLLRDEFNARPSAATLALATSLR
jgi:DNA-binding SARP family transcriptional activator